MNEIAMWLGAPGLLLAPVFYKLLFMSVTAVMIAAPILVLRRLSDKRVSPFWKYMLWLVVLVALVLPVRPASPFSLTGVSSRLETVSYRGDYERAQISYQQALSDTVPPNDAQAQAVAQKREAAQTLYAKTLVFDHIIPLVWAAGAAFLSAAMIIGRARLASKIKRSALDVPPSLSAMLQECKDALGIQARVGLTVQTCLKAPALLGVFVPHVILPTYAAEMDEEHLRYVMLHELAHHKRRDSWINALLLGLQAVYWFNPLILLLFRLIRQDMELANDAHVLRVVGEGARKAYSLSLVDVLGRSSGVPLVPRLLCMVDDKKNIRRRIDMLALGTAFKRHRVKIAIGSLMLIALISVLFLTSANTDKVFSKSPDTRYAVSYNARAEVVTVRDTQTGYQTRIGGLTEPEAIWSPDGVKFALNVRMNGRGYSEIIDMASHASHTIPDKAVLMQYAPDIVPDSAVVEEEYFKVTQWLNENEVFVQFGWRDEQGRQTSGSFVRDISGLGIRDLTAGNAVAIQPGESVPVNELPKGYLPGSTPNAPITTPSAPPASDAEPLDLQASVSQAVLEHNKGRYMPGSLATEAHSTLAVEEEENLVTVYLMSMYMEFEQMPGDVRNVSGGHLPIAITFRKSSNGAYTVIEYWTASDGSKYGDSIRAKFPKDAVADALDTQKFVYAHFMSCYEQAIAQASLDVEPTIDALLDALCTSPKTVSEVFAQRKSWGSANNTEYRQLIYHGRHTLRRFFALFEQGDMSETQANVMAAACSDITAYKGEKATVFSDNDGRAWYDTFRAHALVLQEKHGPDTLERDFPGSWVLLQTLIK